MAWEELGRDAGHANSRGRDRLVGVYIGILAVVLAICSLGGSNAEQDATQQNSLPDGPAFFSSNHDNPIADRAPHPGAVKQSIDFF